MPVFARRKGSYSLDMDPPAHVLFSRSHRPLSRKCSEPTNLYSEKTIPDIILKIRTKSSLEPPKPRLIASITPLKRYRKRSENVSSTTSAATKTSVEVKQSRRRFGRRSSCLEEYLNTSKSSPHLTAETEGEVSSGLANGLHRNPGAKDSMFSRESRLRCSTGSIDHRMMREKCPGCGYVVKSRDRVKYGRFNYHQICFKCSQCEVILNPKSYPVRPKKIGPEDALYCDEHRKPATNGGSIRDSQSDNAMDLFDLIARTQNSRIDDQRCELPGVIQKYRSVSHLTQESHNSTDHERVVEMIKRSKGPYPQVLEPMTGGYWVEGFVDKRQSDSDHMLRIANLDPKTYELLRSDSVNYYKQHFLSQEHQNYLSQDDILGTVVVSVKKEHDPDVGKLYRTIVRTKVNTIHELVTCESESVEPSVAELTRLCNDSITTNKFYPVTTLDASPLIKSFDDRFMNRNFKFGVIYQEKGQTKEEQFFGNNTTTPAFSEFLELIGQRVPLQGFDGFRGGLDTMKGQTGAESIHTDFEGREIMFHISTMLPYTNGDSQQLQRKRHIGNDIVAVVFQEESTPFIPNVIASQFLHAYIIVQPVEACSDNTRYKISVAARTDVPNTFGPALQKSKLIKKECLRDFLLTKLLNAEYASHNAPNFKDKMERTRLAYITELYDELLKMTLDSWCGFSSVTHEKTAMNIFDSFKKVAMKRFTDSTYNTKKSTSSATSSEGSKTPTQEHKISKLPYSHKKMHSDIALSSHMTSWDRSTSYNHNKTWNESSSLASFRSQGSSYKSEADNSSLRSDSSPKESSRNVQRTNGRSSSPTSLGSYGAEDDDGFLTQDHDSDTGVGSMSPTETPHGTWETRLNASKSFNGSPSPCNRCPNCDPDLDYIALLKKEIVDLRKSKSQYSAEVHNLRAEVQEFTRRDKNNRNDLRDKTKQNLKLQHQIDELKTQNQTYRNDLSRLQAMVAGMSGEEIV